MMGIVMTQSLALVLFLSFMVDGFGAGAHEAPMFYGTGEGDETVDRVH